MGSPCGGVFAVVGVVLLLWPRLEGRGEEGGNDVVCLAIAAIFFLSEERRLRIMKTTIGSQLILKYQVVDMDKVCLDIE